MPDIDIVSKLKTPEECATYEKNVTERGRPDLALAARKRAIELRAQAHGARTDAERECLEAVYAYEKVLSANRGKHVKAARTWQMIDRHGIRRARREAQRRCLRFPPHSWTWACKITRLRPSFYAIPLYSRSKPLPV